MSRVAHAETVRTIQFLNGNNGGILQVIPLSNDKCFVTEVKGFRDFEYSFEGPVPFSGDKRLAFNRIRETDVATSPNGFRLVGREFNRMARLSGTNDPETVSAFRTSLNNSDELITFITPDYSDNGRIVPSHSLSNLVRSSSTPQDTCLAAIEVRCERNFDYIPSRSTHFFFYFAHKMMVVSHVVHNGPPLDCPGEEWEARAYEASPENDIREFFAHNDAAIWVELRTLPRGLLSSVLHNYRISCGGVGELAVEFRPVMQPNREAAYRFSPLEIPDRNNRSHLEEFQEILRSLHVVVSGAAGGH
jgi:hypothetical protein